MKSNNKVKMFEQLIFDFIWLKYGINIKINDFEAVKSQPFVK